MSQSLLFRQMITACQKAFQFSLLPNHLKLKRQYKKLEHKDILTLAEAAFYLGKDTGTVVEEVGLGKLPGGKLDGQWHFSKSALNEHFSIYHADIPVGFDDDEIYYQSGEQFSNFEAIRNLLQGYAL